MISFNYKIRWMWMKTRSHYRKTFISPWNRSFVDEFYDKMKILVSIKIYIKNLSFLLCVYLRCLLLHGERPYSDLFTTTVYNRSCLYTDIEFYIAFKRSV